MKINQMESSCAPCVKTRECIASQAKKNNASCKICAASMKLQFKISSTQVTDPTPFSQSENWDRMSRRNPLKPLQSFALAFARPRGFVALKAWFQCGAFNLSEHIWQTWLMNRFF
jgi:hypothetical protein